MKHALVLEKLRSVAVGNCISDVSLDPKRGVHNLVWRVSERGRVAPYWRQMKKGKAIMERLGEERVQAEDGLDQALAVIDRVRAMVRSRIEEAGRESIEKAMGVGLERTAPAVSRERLMKAYDEYLAGADIEEMTAKRNKGSLDLVVTRTRSIKDWNTEVLSEDLIVDFGAQAMVAAKEKAEKLEEQEARVLLRRAGITLSSTVRQALSIFSDAALMSKPYRALNLGEKALARIAAMKKVKVGESTLQRYRPPAPEAFERLAKELPELRLSNPAWWMGAMLAGNGALRRKSVAQARWAWFGTEGKDDRGVPCIELRVEVNKTDDADVKQSFPLAVYEEMKETRSAVAKKCQDDYIIPGEDFDARYLLLGELSEWLRKIGLATHALDKPLHHLRKHCFNTYLRTVGREQASAKAGHATAGVGKAYGREETVTALRVI